ncbi:GPP34 family phosphoprotein [Streptomyces sp. NPDC020917]|uniref:GOLPH3/VPS74 family protein n=1 Tax=Streptomyces sp. NPDC020917 TaxID=3365102 RepID=UPI0037B8586F
MTTAWDLMIVTRDGAGGPVDPDDLSLALAGAELLDLMEAGAASLDGDRIVPGLPTSTRDALLDQAAGSLQRERPHESVGAWLWRRGERLSSAYLAGLETEGYAVRARHRWVPIRSDDPSLVDSPAREHAAERWASGEPVLSVLAAAAGVPDREPDVAGHLPDDVTTVLAAVGNAVTELEAVRQRRRVEQQAFDNIWRAP